MANGDAVNGSTGNGSTGNGDAGSGDAGRGRARTAAPGSVVLVLAAAVAGAWGVGALADGVDGADGVRDALRGDGLAVFGGYGAAVLAGSALRTATPKYRSRPVGAVWAGAVLALAFGALLALLAWPVAEIAPATGHDPVSNRDPGFVYPLWLAFTLLPPALAAAGVQMGLPLAPQPKTGTGTGIEARGGSGVRARTSLPLPAADTVRRGVLRGLAWGAAPFGLLLLLSAL
ncbi:hypothetical protein ABZ747_05875 [Kitasatospora cineracea]|uniref:hypothetical protein n=1 Tax=Kitasatospora cineracea TaxID=88074 RepID=UPI0033FD8C8F